MYNIGIIGAGPGGYVAAIRAAQLGKKVVIIEESHLGGVCLNWGCIPTKALLRSAELYMQMKHHAKDFGIIAENVRFNLDDMIERSRNIAKTLNTGIGSLLKKNKVEVIYGRAKLDGANQIIVNDKNIEVENIILATGARARMITPSSLESHIWDYKKAMTPDKLPRSLIIIGSGAIGIEFASFYNALGVEVTIIEMLSQILGNEDEEIARMARKKFEERGIKILTDTAFKNATIINDQIQIEACSNGQDIVLRAERAISAIGIIPNLENLGLEALNLKMNKGFLVVDEYMQTSSHGIYAIGDITFGMPWLAHTASEAGIICVEKIAGLNPHPINKHNIPSCIYSTPQIASVGFSEKDAIANGYDISVGRFPLSASGKAIAISEQYGMVKTIIDNKTSEILGVSMIGTEVTEMIHSMVLAKQSELTEAEIISTIFPHPTISEAIKESFLSAIGRALHYIP